MSNTDKRERWESGLLLLAALVAAALVVLLGFQNRALKGQVTELRARVETLEGLVASLRPGDALPELLLADLDGEVASLNTLMAGGGVVVFFTTTCPACRETLPSWDRIADAYAERGVAFVGVSLHRQEPTAVYVREHRIDWPTWLLTEEARAGPPPGIGGVPLTLIIAPGGTVTGAWLGVLQENERDGLVAALDGELAAASRVLSGSPAGDPGCCDNLAFDGTDARR